MGTFTYLKNLVTDKNIASVTPSSAFTVKKTTRVIDFTKDNVIVEFGPGTGVFSEYLLKNLTPGSKLILIEMNAEFANVLHGIQDDRVSVYNESAEKVQGILDNEGIIAVDYYISGIPFSFLDEPIKDRILSRASKSLAPDGRFLAYQTSSHLKKPLLRHFSKVDTSFEWRNIPPMCIFEASL